jgi:hypothetical protein
MITSKAKVARKMQTTALKLMDKFVHQLNLTSFSMQL